MKRLVLAGFLCVGLVGCAHVATTKATFVRQSDKPLVLTIARHMDTIVRGPDDEEDQRLVLELRSVEVGKRYAIPSDDVAAHFSVQRFGPASQGETFHGAMVVKKVSEKQVIANVNLVVTARTADRSYAETARFRGDYTFTRD
jgi:hypothetical protein